MWNLAFFQKKKKAKRKGAAVHLLMSKCLWSGIYGVFMHDTYKLVFA